MKWRQIALLLTLGLTAEWRLAAQTLLGDAHASLAQALSLSPALNQGLKVSQETPSTPAPLTAKERMNLFWDETYASPGLWAGVAGGAVVDQLRHTPLKWDADGGGYTRRFASEYGQLAARNVIHDGLAGVTGADPRYTVCTCQGTMRRSAHVLKMTLTANRQDGRLTMNVPEIASAYGSGMISTFWFPHRQFNPLVQGVQFGHEQMGEIVLNHLVEEFSPEIQRRLHLHALTARVLASQDDDD